MTPQVLTERSALRAPVARTLPPGAVRANRAASSPWNDGARRGAAPSTRCVSVAPHAENNFTRRSDVQETLRGRWKYAEERQSAESCTVPWKITRKPAFYLALRRDDRAPSERALAHAHHVKVLVVCGGSYLKKRGPAAFARHHVGERRGPR